MTVMVALALSLAACTAKNTASNPSPGTSTVTTPTAVPAGKGPITSQERAWLDGIAALHKSMDDIPSTINSGTMRSIAGNLSGCTRTLEGLGSFTDRLRPAADLAKQACAEYEKSGQCFKTAGDIGPVVQGSAEDKKYHEASDCAFNSLSEGGKLLADAELKVHQIEEAAAR